MSSQRDVMSRNLKRLIKSKGIDQRQLAEHLGISEMSVSNWVKGNKYPRINNIQKMADYFGVKKSDLIEDKTEKNILTSTEYHYLPTAISAGLPINVDGITESEKISIPDSVMGKWAGNKDIFITKIFGDSMDKIMPDGSLIAVKPLPLESLKNGDIVVFSNCYDYSVKHYFKYDDKLIFKPNSYNRAHHEQHYNIDDDIVIHGKVVMHSVLHD